VTVTVSPTIDDVYSTLRAFLFDILGTGVIEIFQTQDDRVGEPAVREFITMTPVRFPRLGTNFESLDVTGLQAILLQPQEFVMQLDIYGDNSYDYMSKITTMFRSNYGVEFFAGLNAAIAPLYHSDPHQMPFINAEQGYETRYSMDLSMQVNLTATTVTQSAVELSLDTINADTNPANWPNTTFTVTAAS
jgi:hypothetical protein